MDTVAGKGSTTAAMRRLLRAVLRTDSELDSFCIDYCRPVFDLFTSGMTRSAKLNLLLESETANDLLCKLRAFDPVAMTSGEARALVDLLAGPTSDSSGWVCSSESHAVPVQQESGSFSTSAPSVVRGQLRGRDEMRPPARRWLLAALFALGGATGIGLLGVGEHYRRQSSLSTLQYAPVPVAAQPPAPAPASVGVREVAGSEQGRALMIQIHGGWLRRGLAPALTQRASAARDVLVHDFEIDVREVTVAAYRECVEDSQCVPPYASQSANLESDDPNSRKGSILCNGLNSQRAQHPVNCVDAAQAESYCEWRGKRLPTEDEWLYAARGSTTQDFPWGSDPPTPEHLNACGLECVQYMRQLGIEARALYSGKDRWPATAPVGSFHKDRSLFGVLDMAGNVAEWTSSCVDSGPCGPSDAHVYLGGSWNSSAQEPPTLSLRQALSPKSRDYTIGFRCAR